MTLRLGRLYFSVGIRRKPRPRNADEILESVARRWPAPEGRSRISEAIRAEKKRLLGDDSDA